MTLPDTSMTNKPEFLQILHWRISIMRTLTNMPGKADGAQEARPINRIAKFLRTTQRSKSLAQAMNWCFLIVFIGTLIAMAPASAEVAVPALASRVTDLTSTLSSREIHQLEQKLTAFEQTKGSQIAVLMIPTTHPEAIEQYSIRVAEAWKLGRKGIDDGVLLLIAKNDRALRIETGYGLEGVLPDATAKRIIAGIITPHFKQNRFFDGIDAGIDAIIRVIEGESLPLPQSNHPGNAESYVDYFAWLLIFPFVFGRTLQVLFGRLAGAAVTGAGLGLIGWLLFSSLGIALLIAIAGFIMTLFLNPGSGVYRSSRGRWPGHDFRSGGFGGGGFSGGGGGFGGGGASGRW